MESTWLPSSWHNKPMEQRVEYPDPQALCAVLQTLAKLPPLVTSWEVESLGDQLAEASRGERFLLQGGDCSESFDDCEAAAIASKLKILLKMSLVLVYGCRKPVIRVGRFAGQYAKPRSAQQETRDGQTLLSYRGPMVNRPGFSLEDRTPDPALLLESYHRSALTLNFIRGLVDGGFADMHHPELWNLDFVNHAARANEYRRVMDNISTAVHFMETVAGRRMHEITRVDFFTSHEGLQLNYEQAQTRQVPRRGERWYNLSTHFPWIGDRTRTLDGAHVEYFRGIVNPIGVKVGPSITTAEILELSRLLNPENKPGHLTFIHRFGVRQIADCLPPLVRTVQSAGRNVLWCCDPMHGNTRLTSDGVRTRSFEDILGELQQAFDIHHQLKSILGGVHFELTGEDVTECTGGARGLSDADLGRAYSSDLDPRLNYEQSLEMALLIADRMNRSRG
jgi:3-deoxy-7-phosphoheptulonate synthase